MENIFSLLGRKKSTFFLIVFLFLALAAMSIFSQKLNYSTRSRLIVMNGQNITDPYTTSRFNEYIGELLSKTVVSGKFFDEVMNSGYTIDKSYFTDDPNEQNKIWTKSVNVEPLYSVGIIDIEVYHPDPLQSRQIAIAINNILKTKSVDYYSGGNSIKVEILNEPTTSKWIVKPNIPLNIAIGLIFGVFFAFSYIYLFPEERYDVRLWPRSGKKTSKEAETRQLAARVQELQAVIEQQEAGQSQSQSQPQPQPQPQPQSQQPIIETRSIEEQLASVIAEKSRDNAYNGNSFKGEGNMKNLF